MPANTEKMFSVREAVWWEGGSEDHGQITKLGDHPTWEKARVLAGLNWDPQEEDLNRPLDLIALRHQYERIMFDAELTDAERLDRLTGAAANAQKTLDGWKHVYRDDTAATLACTQDTYQVISNSDFGGIFDAVLGQDNVKFETGGCAAGGRKVWMLAKLDEPITLPGDNTVTVPYLALMSRHDALGSTALRGTNVRIVCENTFNFAEMQGQRGAGSYSFVHKGDWRSRMDEARNAVQGVRQEAKAYEALANELLQVRVTKSVTNMFVTEFIPAPPKGVASDRVLGNVEASRDKLREILAGPTVAGAGVGGTAYGLVQAGGEYLDHARTARSWETKLNRSLLKPEPQKARVMSIVRELTA